MKRPSVTFQPRSGKYLLHGIDAMADLLRPTIGPMPRFVASEQAVSRSKPPELLSDGATLARRIIQLSKDPSDMGAMLLRHAVWRVGEKSGDGTATTAVMARAMARHAYKVVAAGANAMRVRTGIEAGVAAANQALRAQSTPVSSRTDLTHIANSLCHDDELARILGEAFNIIGTDGYVEVQTSRSRKVEREYVEGACWRSSTGWFSSSFTLTPAATHIDMENAAVLLLDGKLTNALGAARMFGKLLEAGRKNVFLVCREIAEPVLSVMVVNHKKDVIKLLPVKMPVMEMDRMAMFEDLAALTGAKVVYIGDSGDLSGFTLEAVGGARRVWAEVGQFGVIGGKGSPKALREHIKTLKGNLVHAKDKDKPEDQRIDTLRKRLARIMGGTCVLSIGAPTEAEQKARQQIAERGVRAMYSIVRGGIVPGGGAAYLACQEAVRRLAIDDPDVRAGANCVVAGLEELMRAIARNTGADPSATVARSRQAGKGFGYDATTQQIVDMRKAGIVDSAEVLGQVLASAGSVAALAVSTDVLIRKRKPTEVFEP